MDSFGVYAIIEFTSFYVLLFGLTEKSEGGWGYNYRDELSTFISHRVPEAIFFFRNLVMTTMDEIIGWRGQGR